MTTTTLFRSNRSQAVQLAKDVAFPDTVNVVQIIKDGPRRIIVPAESSWDDFFNSPGIDIQDRLQPGYDERESF